MKFLLALFAFVSIFDLRIATAGPLDPQKTFFVDNPNMTGLTLRIYEQTATGPIKRGEAPVPDSPAIPSVRLTNIPVGSHTYIARFFDGAQEGGDSNPATFQVAPPPPPAPVNLR